MAAIVFALLVAVIVYFVLNFVIGSKSKSTKLDRQRSEEEVLLDLIPPTNYPHDVQKGNLDEIAKEGSLSKFVHKLHTKFGSIIKVHLQGNKPVVCLSDPNLIKETLRLGDRPRDLFKFLEPMLTSDNIQIMSEEHAKNFRKLILPAFGHQAIKVKYEGLVKEAQVITDRFSSYCNERKTVLVQAEFFKYSLRAMVWVVFSAEASSFDFDKFQQCYDDVMVKLYQSQFLSTDQLSAQKLNESIQFIKNIVKDFISQRTQHPAATDEKERDMCEIITQSMNPNTHEPFTEEQQLSYLGAYMIAGYHTTAVAAMWCIFGLTQHKDVQKKLQHEIDTVMQNRTPSLEDLDKLPYLTQLIKESIRCYNPAPFAARLVVDPQEIGGFVIPANTTLFYSLSSIHQNPHYWPQPEKFDPERFNTKQANTAFCPFGFGARICPGERVAWVEAKLLLALLVQKYEFELAMPLEEIVIDESLVAMSKNDLQVTLKKRSE